MAVKDTNERIIITLTKKQVAFIRTNAKKLGITPSRFVKWLLDKNISHLLCRMGEDELNEVIRVAKIKWVDFMQGEDGLTDD